VFAEKNRMTHDAGLATALRAPLQGRSKASYERMLAAAEVLLTERGSDDFTLLEVSKQGKVSIGSIYNRFESKDALLHAVQLRVLSQLDKAMFERIAAARAGHVALPSLVVALVDTLAETLREFGPPMRALMARASSDPMVASVGKASYLGTAKAIEQALLEHRADMQVANPERSVESAFRVLYAAIARYLGFGTSSDASWEGDWTVLKADMAQMMAAFLMSKTLI
jgi:AcrR family transcriptional regulator